MTIPATGSEMNQFSVLQNHRTGEKSALHSELMFPVHSFLDPSYTYSDVWLTEKNGPSTGKKYVRIPHPTIKNTFILKEKE